MSSEINRRQRWAEQSIPLDRHSLYRKIDRITRVMPPGRVLEVGCLNGRYLERLHERGWSVHASTQPQEHDYIVVHDAADPFPFGKKFDLVIAAEVVEHIVDTDAFLEHCADVLKPCGVLILTTPHLLFGGNRLLMLVGRRPRFAYADYMFGCSFGMISERASLACSSSGGFRARTYCSVCATRCCSCPSRCSATTSRLSPPISS